MSPRPNPNQYDLFTDLDHPQPAIPIVGDHSIQQRFQLFHDANPWVYHRLVALAKHRSRQGLRRIGMKMLFEVLRWQYLETVDPTSDFKLNNNYHSRYARLITEREPELAGVFEMRQLKAA